MKKAFRHLLATLLALAMVCALAAPVFAEHSDFTGRQFGIYQIFKGDVSTNKDGKKIISNVTWGESIDGSTILSYLTQDPTIGSNFNDCHDAKDVVEVIKANKWADSDDNMIALARFFSTHHNSDHTTASNAYAGAVTFNEDGYYLIVDPYTGMSNSLNTAFGAFPLDHANNFAVLYLGHKDETFEVTIKNVYPTVRAYPEKLKPDGSSAGFPNNSNVTVPINKSFKTQAIATMPQDQAYQYYNEYPVSFIIYLPSYATYDDLKSVTLKTGTGSTSLDNSKYTVEEQDYTDPDTNELSHHIAININNLKALAPTLGKEEIKIKAEFTMHLNTTLPVDYCDITDPGSYGCGVLLKYPSNPAETSSTSFSVTSDSLTFNTFGIKVNKVTDQNTPLPGAKFRLYTDEKCENELKLKADTTNTTCYYPVLNNNDDGADMVSPADGKFSICGLNEGTYYLKEVETPAGYNTAEPAKLTFKVPYNIKINVADDLKKDTDGNMSVTIVNKSGVVLPSTGGMGTTIFYVVGGLLMVGAAVLLVTKKRMQKN